MSLLRRIKDLIDWEVRKENQKFGQGPLTLAQTATRRGGPKGGRGLIIQVRRVLTARRVCYCVLCLPPRRRSRKRRQRSQCVMTKAREAGWAARLVRQIAQNRGHNVSYSWLVASRLRKKMLPSPAQLTRPHLPPNATGALFDLKKEEFFMYRRELLCRQPLLHPITSTACPRARILEALVSWRIYPPPSLQIAHAELGGETLALSSLPFSVVIYQVSPPARAWSFYRVPASTA